jgi:alkylation response protein AidB-like acyl-CoA dehydrogenase
LEYFLSDVQKSIKTLARTIAEEQILPVRAKLDETEEFPWQIIKHLGDAGLFGIFIPEEYGGTKAGIMELCLVVEELSRVCSGVALCYAATALGVTPIILFGNDTQKRKYLPDIAAGKKLAGFAITEENAGSDAGGLETIATKVTGGYKLNGTKRFITNGGEAVTYVVIALTDKSKGPRGATAFIVEKGMTGFSFGRKENKMGIRASATRELVFDDCFVPAENILSREGMGFIITMRTFDFTRPGIAAQALGVAQGAFEAALNHAKTRNQFGHPIIAIQSVQHMLANMAMDIEATRGLVYNTARTIDSGVKDTTLESAMAKVFSSDMAMRITTDAIQIFGGVGYMRDYPVEKMMRDAKITQIYEGTNQVLRNVIGSELRKRK